MSIFEYIVAAGLLIIVIILGLAVWSFHNFSTRPVKEAKKEKQKLVKVDIDRAKLKLDTTGHVETRMDPNVVQSELDDTAQMNKLRALRRKK